MRLEDIEIFVPTCGQRPSLRACISCLEALNTSTPYRVLKGFAPMSRAFDEMIRAATKPYFIQVDDDMLLAPDAVKKLAATMGSDVAMGALWLWDVHVGRPILGCKIYNTAAIRDIGGWRNVQSCEVDLNDRLKAAGWTINVVADATVFEPPFDSQSPVIVGRHDPMFTPSMAYERYRDLVLKHRRLKNALWVEALPSMFLERVRAHGNKVDLAALAGCISGMTAPLDVNNHEKDFSQCPWMSEYNLVEKLLGLEVT